MAGSEAAPHAHPVLDAARAVVYDSRVPHPGVIVNLPIRTGLTLATLLLVACPDPTVDEPGSGPPPIPAVGGAEPAPPPAEGAAAPGEGGAMAAAGTPPAEGAPGVPPEGAAPTDAAGTPGAPGAQPPGTMGTGALPPGLPITGAAVTVSGTISYAGSKSGIIRIDVAQKDAGNGRYRPVHFVQVDELGAYSFKLPANAGEIRLLGFIDTDGNGPGLEEPAAVVDGLTVGTADLPGVALTLTDGGSKALADDEPGEPLPAANP